jgi:hypothetical protein
MDSGSRITARGWGSGYAAILAHAPAGGALYGTELGSVTFTVTCFFCQGFQLNTQHTGKVTVTRKEPETQARTRYGTRFGDLEENWFLLFPN